MDLFGLVNIMFIVKKKYALVIVDYYSRYTCTMFLHSKDEATQIIINHIFLLEKGTTATVRALRSDNGTEFKNSIFNDFCTKNGIAHYFSAPRTPQQNGIVERKNRTLIKATRTILIEAKLPTYFWAEAVMTV